ncbi:hypothetical protein CTAYLR_004770 [Chrysophaeum taylorii]|uniref:Helicase ATP-binding domain-containing protein n=1 Tax=Chrysophaeum taylorii TaxID=2483200 RepID=A0AAD7UNI7_9STRA|nr:hypothetical protein CTAYLR_004770 [Chrysophaeum taylorii]
MRDGRRRRAEPARALRRGGGCDVLIATPGRLAKLIKSGAVSLSRASDVVLDEVDVLAIADGGAMLRPIFGDDSTLSSSARFAFVTATLPTQVEAQLEGVCGRRGLQGPGLHKAPLGLEVSLVECDPFAKPAPASSRRRADLSEYLVIDEDDDDRGRASPTKQRLRKSEKTYEGDLVPEPRPPVERGPARVPTRTLVFCNTIESCRRVENALYRADRRRALRTVYAYHSALEKDARKRALAAFIDPNSTSRATLPCSSAPTARAAASTLAPSRSTTSSSSTGPATRTSSSDASARRPRRPLRIRDTHALAAAAVSLPTGFRARTETRGSNKQSSAEQAVVAVPLNLLEVSDDAAVEHSDLRAVRSRRDERRVRNARRRCSKPNGCSVGNGCGLEPRRKVGVDRISGARTVAAPSKRPIALS